MYLLASLAYERRVLKYDIDTSQTSLVGDDFGSGRGMYFLPDRRSRVLSNPIQAFMTT